MSDLLDTLTKLGEAATEGPWTLSDRDNEIWSPEVLHVIVKAYNHGRAAGIDKHEDAAYIVALVNAAPQLIALAKLAESADLILRDVKANMFINRDRIGEEICAGWLTRYATAKEPPR
jgi:hypothetical protein